MPNPNQEAVEAADEAVIALQGTVHSDADKVVAALEAARPAIEKEVREADRDAICEEIEREEARRSGHKPGSEPFFASTGTLRGLRLALAALEEAEHE